MNILEEIIAWKKKEVSENKSSTPIHELEQRALFTRPIASLREFVCRKDLSGIIAEFKRQSPSKGMINKNAQTTEVCPQYAEAGASALSVLTDNKYFGGNNSDLLKARELCAIPILRKDFIVDEYQIVEARSIGADVILLIAEVLTRQEMKNLFEVARSLELETLFEVHDEENMDKLPPDAQVIGINNRNLKTFDVSIEQSIMLAEKLPQGVIKIAESGIDSPETLLTLKKSGFDGFLMGERFMREENPGMACKRFIEKVKQMEK